MHAPATSARGRRALEEALQGAADPCPPSASGVRGFSLLELVLVLGLLALTAAIAVRRFWGDWTTPVRWRRRVTSRRWHA